MPVYVFRCTKCALEFEEFRHGFAGRDSAKCGFCGSAAVRAHDKETVHVVPDIEPRYDIPLGKNITSRREYREALAYQNAWSPDLMLNDSPNDGRLTREERMELEGTQVNSVSGNIFERRKRAGWGSSNEKDAITVEGKADYEPIKEHIRKQHERRLEQRGE